MPFPVLDATPPDQNGIVLRRCGSQDDYAACVAIQDETWGSGFSERVPTAILMVGQKIGGVTAGAFAASGRMLGFVFGLTGVRDGRLVHWSDMLAVRPEARRLGLGARLKLFQRDLLRPLGVRSVLWTFDPLEARNAHLNLVKLGARAAEYVPDMYGTSTNSPLHGNLGTDRFIVDWSIAEKPAPPSALAPADLQDAPVVNAPANDGTPGMDGPFPDVLDVRIEVPASIQDVMTRSPDLARRWRDSTRRAFLWYLDRDYHVDSFARDASASRAFYALTRRSR